MKKIKIVILAVLLINGYAFCSSSVKEKNKKADEYISQNRFKDAINEYLEITKADPSNTDAVIKLARVYSWIEYFDDSVKHYDKAIKLTKSADMGLYVEKARVLGWAGRVKESLKAYQTAFEKFNIKWVEYEMQGKKYLWDHKIYNAMEYFEKSLKEKSDNPEVLFDLAQLYSNLGCFEKAGGYYKEIMKVSPYNSAAKKSQIKNLVMKKGLEIDAGHSHWNAKSTERSTDVDMLSDYLIISKIFSESYQLVLNGSVNNYSFDRLSGISENCLGVRAGYRNSYFWSAGGEYLLKMLNGSANNREGFSLFFAAKMLQNLDFELFGKQENMINNRRNILSDLNDRYLKSKISYDYNRYFLFSADLRSGKLTDKNNYNTSGIESTVTFPFNKKSVYCNLRLEHQAFKETSSEYYAPSDYTTFSQELCFKHYLNSEGLYYGALKIYYILSARITEDSNSQTAVRPAVDFYWEVSKRTSMKLSWSATNSKYYDDTSANLSITVYP